MTRDSRDCRFRFVVRLFVQSCRKVTFLIRARFITYKTVSRKTKPTFDIASAIYIILSCRSVRVIVRSRFSVGGSVFEIGITWLLFWNTEFYWVSSAIIWLNECCPTERTTTKGTSTRSWTSSRCARGRSAWRSTKRSASNWT